MVVGGVRLSKRHGRLLTAYLEVLHRGKSGREALMAAADEGGLGGVVVLRDHVKVARMEKFLNLPDVREAIRRVYEQADFSLAEAVEKHVEHIRDGNYQALKDYLAGVMPSEAKRVHVLTARVPASREVRTDGSPPPMTARPIGKVVEE
jgi:hypothetical protein